MTNESTLAVAAPAYRIETERTVLRCWNPADAPHLQAALNDSTFRDSMIWTLLSSEYAGTPSAQAELVAFDVLGNRVL